MNIESEADIMVETGRPLPSKVNCTDLTLVCAMVDGDEWALGELYARHGASLLVYLNGQLGNRGLAEEILQDVMLAAWKGVARFRRESSVRTWLFAIARHKAINARRKKRLALVSLNDKLMVDSPSPLETLETSAEQAEVQGALRHLPAEQQETLELVFYHGMSGPEAAAVLGVAPGTVKSRLYRAKAMLRKLLHQESHPHE